MQVQEQYGQAVLEEFNGKDATFILCNSNENNICREITYERIKRVIEGYKNQKGYNVQGIESNLKYYKLKYIDRYNREDEGYYIVNELSKYIREMVQLEHQTDLTDENIQILLSDKDVDNFANNEDLVNKCKIIYLDNNALITEDQIEKFEKNNIKICYIPDYYFENEIIEVEQW